MKNPAILAAATQYGKNPGMVASMSARLSGLTISNAQPTTAPQYGK